MRLGRQWDGGNVWKKYEVIFTSCGTRRPTEEHRSLLQKWPKRWPAGQVTARLPAWCMSSLRTGTYASDGMGPFDCFAGGPGHGSVLRAP